MEEGKPVVAVDLDEDNIPEVILFSDMGEVVVVSVDTAGNTADDIFSIHLEKDVNSFITLLSALYVLRTSLLGKSKL